MHIFSTTVVLSFTGTHSLYWHVHEISALIAYAQMTIIKAHPDISSKARGLNFGLSLHLSSLFINSRTEDSGKSAHMHMRRLVWGCAAHWCNYSTKITCTSAHTCRYTRWQFLYVPIYTSWSSFLGCRSGSECIIIGWQTGSRCTCTCTCAFIWWRTRTNSPAHPILFYRGYDAAQRICEQKGEEETSQNARKSCYSHPF